MKNNKEIHLDRKYKTYFEKNGFKQEVVVNLYEYIGYQIDIIKKEKKLKNHEIVKKSGLSNQTVISRIKKGKHGYQIDTLYKLCKGLGCKSSDLLPF